MANYYQSYYQGKHYNGVSSGYETKKACAILAKDKGVTTEKQLAYHASLLSFLKGKGVVFGTIFEKPRSKKDCCTKINGLLTLLYKNNLQDEFFGGGYSDDK